MKEYYMIAEMAWVPGLGFFRSNGNDVLQWHPEDKNYAFAIISRWRTFEVSIRLRIEDKRVVKSKVWRSEHLAEPLQKIWTDEYVKNVNKRLLGLSAEEARDLIYRLFYRIGKKKFVNLNTVFNPY